MLPTPLHAGQWLPDWRPGQDFSESYSASTVMGGGVIFDLIHEIDSHVDAWKLNPLCCYSTSVESLNISPSLLPCLACGLHPTSWFP